MTVIYSLRSHNDKLSLTGDFVQLLLSNVLHYWIRVRGTLQVGMGQLCSTGNSSTSKEHTGTMCLKSYPIFDNLDAKSK